MKKVLAVLLACAASAYPQGATSLMSGTVTDPQGALIPGADISVSNPATGQLFKTSSTDKRGGRAKITSHFNEVAVAIVGRPILAG